MTHQSLLPVQTTGAGLSFWLSPLLAVEQVSKKLSGKAGETTTFDAISFEVAQSRKDSDR